jgi:hypothetical protein
VGEGFAFGEVINQLVSLATDAATKPVLTVASSAGDQVDASIAGYDNYSQDNSRDNGGTRLSPGAVAELNAAAVADQAAAAQQKGLAYQLLSPSYDHSLVSDLIMKTPLSPSDFTHGADTALAVIANPLNGKLLTNIGSFLVNSSPSAAAYSTADNAEDPSGYGVPQMGLPDELLAKYPNSTDNEQWVITYLCRNHGPNDGLYDGQCSGSSTDGSGELTDQNISHNDEYHNFIQKCLLNDDPDTYLGDSDCTATDETHERFRVYRLDTQIANMIMSYNNNKDDQSTAGASTAPTPATPPTTPTGNAPQLASQILTASLAGKITLAVVNPANQGDGSTAAQNLQETVQGKPANTSTSCVGGGTAATNRTTPLSPVLLQFILDISAQTNFTINELAGGCHTANSNHYKGAAVDFGCPFNSSVADAVGKKYGISDGTGETCASGAGHYHYSIGGN